MRYGMKENRISIIFMSLVADALYKIMKRITYENLMLNLMKQSFKDIPQVTKHIEFSIRGH